MTILQRDTACFLPKIHILIPQAGVSDPAVEIPFPLLQSIKVEFPLFFSSTPAPGSCIEVPGYPVALQDTQITLGLAHLALATH